MLTYFRHQFASIMCFNKHYTLYSPWEGSC